MKNLLNKIKQIFISFGNMTPIAIVTAFLPLVGMTVLLAFGYSTGNWLKEHYLVGMAVFLISTVILCGLALVPTNIVGLIGGFAFGFIQGSALLILGVVASSVVSYFVHKRITNKNLRQLAQENERTRAIYNAIVNSSQTRITLIIFLVRLSIVTPFALTNFIMSAARVPLSSYVIGTFLGMLPRSAAVAFTGAGLAELSFDDTSNIWVIGLGIFATLAAVIIISLISRKALKSVTANSF